MAEKELTYDVPCNIYLCMYLLRAIKNKHWIIEKEPGEPTIFNSYFIKTACYWICEETAQNTEDIIGLVEKIIDWILTSFRNKKIPHYILPEANLIGRLKEDKNFEQAMEWLEDIKKNLVDKIHTSIEYDENFEAVRNILQHLKHSPNSPTPEELMCEAKEVLRRDGEVYSKKEKMLFDESLWFLGRNIFYCLILVWSTKFNLYHCTLFVAYSFRFGLIKLLLIMSIF